MKIFVRVFLVVMVLITVTGCGLMGPAIPSGTGGGGPQRVFFLQVGIQLQVFNLCPQTVGVLYPSHPAPGQEEVVIPPGTPVWVPMAPHPLMGTNTMSATYQVFDTRGNFLGSVSRSFRINTKRGTQTVQWIIGGTDNGSGNGAFTDHVKGPQGQRIC